MKGSIIQLSLVVFLFGLLSNKVGAQPGRPTGTVVLTAEDTAAFKEVPVGFDQERKNIQRGKTDSVEYDSKTVSTRRRLLVYTPPGYSANKKYPVLYLLHGIGGSEKSWYKWTKPDVILDNLLADKKIVPMVVVFPNGRAMKNDADTGNFYSQEKVIAFANFERDLLDDVIPFIEKNYAVKKDKDNRAIAGFSMGGGQSLNFGLGNPDSFAWVGGFSPAPNTKTASRLISDPAALAKNMKLIYIACGNQDALITVSRGMHDWLKKNNVPHVYHIQPGEHNMEPWKRDLYNFSQLIFKN